MNCNDSQRYQIVFSDLDGTLLDSSHQISKNTIAKVQEIDRRGIPFVLVSARMPSGIFPIQRTLGITAPIVCYSGSLILDGRGNTMKSVGIAYEKAMAVKTFITQRWKEACCSACHYDTWIVDSLDNPWVVKEYEITSSKPTEGLFAEALTSEDHLHKFLCMGEAGLIAEMEEGLKDAFPDLTIYRSKDTYLEIMEGSAKKSAAVKFLAGEYDIPIAATVSFGDNFNDMDMLLSTGISFAMENAPDEVKKSATYIAPDNNQEGVFQGLMRLRF